MNAMVKRDSRRSDFAVPFESVDDDLMQIGELAEKARVTVRTVRYYEELGLLEPVRRSDGGFRLYNDLALRRLQLVQSLRALDFPLKEILELMQIRRESPVGSVAGHKLMHLLQLQLARTNERIAQYLASREDIQRAMTLTVECMGCHLEMAAEPCKTCGNIANYVKGHPKDKDERFDLETLEPLLPIAFQAML